jgi:hypothetical protein
LVLVKTIYANENMEQFMPFVVKKHRKLFSSRCLEENDVRFLNIASFISKGRENDVVYKKNDVNSQINNACLKRPKIKRHKMMATLLLRVPPKR